MAVADNSLPLVPWYWLVWHRDHIPRCSFIMCIVCKDRKRTRDKLLQWRKGDSNVCVSCGSDVQNRGHLFFQCNFSSDEANFD